MNLEEHKIKAKQVVDLLEEIGHQGNKILAEDLYSDSFHFIYELIQNADDSEATEICFTLTKNQLELSYNGRQFDEDDIKAILNFGTTTKENNINSIGKFGIGFKSVFSVTESPFIHSGNYHFKIIKYMSFEDVDAIECEGQTVIILPFKDLSKERDIYNKIALGLHNFSSVSLLFLNNIQEIYWETEQDSGYYLCEKNLPQRYACVSSQVNKNKTLEEYLIFTKSVTIGSKDLKLFIAYLKQEEQFFPIEKPLFVFFPTEVKPRFKFLVHVPYKTTPNRETIPFDDQENKQLTLKLTLLIAESILCIKKLRYLNINFLSLLPIDKDNFDPIYQEIFQRLKNVFTEYDLLPTTDSTFSRPQKCLLASSKKMVDLLSSENINSLFKKTNWIDTEITRTKNSTQLLWTYLRECLKIDEISTDTFFSSITSHFLAQQSDEWIINFYIFLNQTSSYSRQRAISQPIIRLEDNRHVEPYGNDNSPQVYFPKENSSRFPTVKRSILENKEAKTFLESLGIKEPDGLAEIKTFIVPKYFHFPGNIISEKDYLKDLDYVYSIWNNSNPNDQSEIIDNLLKDSYFIGCFDNQKSFTICKKEKEDKYDYYSDQAKPIVYVQSQELTSWFEGNTEDQYFFIPQEIGNKYKDFFRKFLVKSSIFLENLNPDQSRKYGSSYYKGVDGFSYRFKIHGLQHSLNHINLSRSLQIWSILLEKTEKLKGKMEWKSTKKPEEAWKPKEHEELSLAMKQLTEHHWLFDKEERLIKIPLADISLINLHQDYDFEHPNSDKLVKILELKSSDEIKAKKLEEKNKRLEKQNAEKDKVIEEKDKVIEKKDKEIEEMKRKLMELAQPNDDLDIVSDESDEWSPEIHPDEVPIGSIPCWNEYKYS